MNRLESDSSDVRTRTARPDFPVADAHCDSMLALVGKSMAKSESGRRDFFSRNAVGHVDLPKLLEGGVVLQFMALFVDDEDLGRAGEYTDRLIDEYGKLLRASDGGLFPILKKADLARISPGTRVGTLLSIEGAEALEGDLNRLDHFHSRGVRAMGISWSRRNPFARGVGVEGTDGLSSLGESLVERLEELSMLVDVSHLSDESFRDLARVAKRPFIASHSNARAVSPHPRNLTDEQIRTVAKSGGAIGAVFVPAFVSREPLESYLARILDHIDHIVDVGGIESAAIGSDFDGFKTSGGVVISDSSEFPLLSEALLRRGYGEGECAKIMAGNWLRVLNDILP